MPTLLSNVDQKKKKKSHGISILGKEQRLLCCSVTSAAWSEAVVDAAAVSYRPPLFSVFVDKRRA